MKIVVDSSVALRIYDQAHVQSPLAVAAIDRLLARGDSPSIVPQVAYEFWVVMTRPVANNGFGEEVPAAEKRLEILERDFAILPDSDAVYPVWRRLVTTYRVKGKPAHDARIVAAMQVHGVSHVLTFNGSDFKRFPEVTIVDPITLLASPGHP